MEKVHTAKLSFAAGSRRKGVTHATSQFESNRCSVSQFASGAYRETPLTLLRSSLNHHFFHPTRRKSVLVPPPWDEKRHKICATSNRLRPGAEFPVVQASKNVNIDRDVVALARPPNKYMSLCCVPSGSSALSQ